MNAICRQTFDLDLKRVVWNVMGTGGSLPGGKAAGREADHSPPTSAEVKDTWIYSFTPQYAFMG
jgi:hypothetical protein